MKKILVVEDDKVLCAVLLEKLAQAGYDAFGIEDGERVIAKTREWNPDCVLLDMLLPGKNGFAILKELAQDEALKIIPVIVISNSGQPVEVERARKLGARDFLIKAEFSPAEVLEKVRTVLNATHGDTATEYGHITAETSPIILVVEDDKFLRELLSQKLAKENFIAQEAIDGNAAITTLEKETPHLVLLDLLLPGMHGFEVLRHIRTTPAYAKIPVIILTNLGQQEDMEKAKNLGATDYLVKANFTLDEIISRVKRVVREYYTDLR